MTTPFFPEHLAFTIALCALLTGGAFWALFAHAHAQSDSPSGRAALGGGLLGLGLWFVAVFALVASGIISRGRADLGVPNLVLAIALPVAVGLVLLTRPGFRRVTEAIPLAMLAGFHALRIVFGVVFIALYELEAAPAVFAFRGGYGDIAAGVLGGLAAVLLLTGARTALALPVLILLTVEGLLDFAVVLYTGLTHLPAGGPLDSFYPFLLIPAFVVPQFMLVHVLMILRLLRAPVTIGKPSARPG